MCSVLWAHGGWALFFNMDVWPCWKKINQSSHVKYLNDIDHILLLLTLSLISLCLHLEKKKTGHGWDSVCFRLVDFDYPLIHRLTLILIGLRCLTRITNSLRISLFVMLIASYLNNSTGDRRGWDWVEEDGQHVIGAEIHSAEWNVCF